MHDAEEPWDSRADGELRLNGTEFLLGASGTGPAALADEVGAGICLPSRPGPTVRTAARPASSSRTRSGGYGAAGIQRHAGKTAAGAGPRLAVVTTGRPPGPKARASVIVPAQCAFKLSGVNSLTPGRTFPGTIDLTAHCEAATRAAGCTVQTKRSNSAQSHKHGSFGHECCMENLKSHRNIIQNRYRSAMSTNCTTHERMKRL